VLINDVRIVEALVRQKMDIVTEFPFVVTFSLM
jgi:hypothetical protein